MGAYWLFDLPDVIAAAGLDVDTWPEWEVRSRGSGGYDQVWAVFAHHTASDTSPTVGLPLHVGVDQGDQPIGAIYLDRDGLVTVGAAGATNCQGQGGPWTRRTARSQRTRATPTGSPSRPPTLAPARPGRRPNRRLRHVVCRAVRRLRPGPGPRHLRPLRSGTGRKIDPAGPSPTPRARTRGTWTRSGPTVRRASPRNPTRRTTRCDR